MARVLLSNVRNLVKAAVNDQPLEKSFVQDLNMCIQKMDEAHKHTPTQAYKPSGMNCIRSMYFEMLGTEQDGGRKSPNLIGICESGEDRHERIQRAISKMKKYGFDCEYIDVETYIKENNLTHLEVIKKDGFETKLYNKELNMRFKCDGIIKYKGVIMIFEFKTESMYKYMNRDAVAKDHETQGAAYSASFKVNKVLWMYENRDNCDRKAFIINVDDATRDAKVINKIRDCDNYLNNLTPPPKPTDVSKKTCDYCDYKTACKAAGK